MGLNGTLATMPLAQLLRWARDGRGTGTLEVQRANVRKRIGFRDGRVIACATDDPPTLMGQFLLSRGRIDQDTLTEALAQQQFTGGNLGQILVDMGAITADDRTSFVEAKIEEAIFGLFDWEDAVFRFRMDEILDSNIIEVDLDVERIIRGGERRKRQVRQTYAVIRSPDTVCRPRQGVTVDDLGEDAIGRRIFELIDGSKPLREIQLHSRTSEFVLNSSLGRLLQRRLVEIVEPPERQPAPEPVADEVVAALEIDWTHGKPAPAPSSAGAPLTDRGMGEALRLIEAGRHETALDLLAPLCEAHPGDQALQQLLSRAEREFEATAYREELKPTKIPILLRPVEPQDTAALSAEESYLLSVLDGSQDIRALSWLTPLRAVDLLRCLRRLLKRGTIALMEPAESRRVATP